MTDGLEALSRLGVDPAARASSLTRVRRDERNEKEQRRRPQEEEPQPRHEADEAEDDGRPHIDVRA